MCQFDESYEAGETALPAAPATRASPTAEATEPAPDAGAVRKLVNASSPAASPAAQCLDQAADVVRTGGQLLAAAAAVVASGPSVLGLAVTGAAYLGVSAAFGASIAKLENCEHEAAAKLKAQ